jgi:hypothetical protein
VDRAALDYKKISEGLMSKHLQDRTLAASIRTKISQIGANPEDNEDLRLEKMLMVSGSLMIIAVAYVWGGIYVVFGELTAASHQL